MQGGGGYLADIYGMHFDLGGVSSREYGLIIASVDTERNISLYGSISGVFFYNRSSDQRLIVGDDLFSSPLSFDVDIVTDDMSTIKHNSRRKIESWLFGYLGYRKMYFDKDDDCLKETVEYVDGEEKRVYLNCRLINPTKIESDGGVVGYKVTIETDTGMFWQDPIIKEFTSDNITESKSILTIDVDTDAYGYTYPKVDILVGSSGGDISIVNNTDSTSRITKFVGLSPMLSFYLVGGKNYVSEGNYEKFSNRNFVRLLPGENKLYLDGDISKISFEWNNKRYI